MRLAPLLLPLPPRLSRPRETACGGPSLTLPLDPLAVYTGTLASSIVLMMDLFHAIDHDRPEQEIKEVRPLGPSLSRALALSVSLVLS